MRKMALFAILWVALTPLTLSSEDAIEETHEVFAPFVSHLKAVSGDNYVQLTWRDSVDLKGTVLIYRHTREITKKNIDRADFLAHVEHGIQSYTDYPTDTQFYYYAAIYEAHDGRTYKIFIPFRNKTLTGTKIKVVGNPELQAATITGLAAELSGDNVVISFDSDRPNRALLLYRSDSPFKNYSDLLRAVSIFLGKDTQGYTDRPPAGIGFYYSVLDAEMVMLGRVKLINGKNTTQVPVVVPLKSTLVMAPESGPVLRDLPLPFLIITREIETGDDLKSSLQLPRYQELQPATSESVAKLLQGLALPRRREMKVMILEADEVQEPTGEVYILRSILDNYLAAGLYRQAESELEEFLSVRRAAEIETRAHFYLAQSYYFQNRYRKALLDFLLARDEHRREARIWLQACFEKLIARD